MNFLLQALKFGNTSGNVVHTTVFKRSLCCLLKNQQITSSPTFKGSYTPIILSCTRNFWETFPYTRPVPHLKDGLDKETHEIVYRCRLFNYAFYAQLGSMTAFAGQIIFGLYHAYESLVHNTAPLATFGGFNVTYDLVTLSILGLFTVQNIVLYYLSQRILLRAYLNSQTNEYIFVSLSPNPFFSRLTYCKAGDMIPLYRHHLLSICGNYKIRNTMFYVKYENFNNLMHFNRLLSENYRLD